MLNIVFSGRRFIKDVSGSCCEYNSNNTWNFNGNNRKLNNNNRYWDVFRCRPVFAFNGKIHKNINDYLISLEELIEVEKSCYNRKSNSVKFRLHYSTNIIDIWHKLNNQILELGETYRVVIDVPKIREIVYCNYADKIVQTFFVKQINPILEAKWLHKDTYSCRKGKGVIAAVEQFQKYLREAVANNKREDVYVATVDIKNFFMSIDKSHACKLISEFINKKFINSERRELLLYLCQYLYLSDYTVDYLDHSNPNILSKLKPEKTLKYNQPRCGVPIGNWPSQVLGNFLTTYALNYLTELGYKFVHYTDDTAIVITDKNKWLKDIKKLEEFYKDKLHLTLHPHKRYLQHYSKGVQFLGRKIKDKRKLSSSRTYYSILTCLKYYLNKEDKKLSYIELENFQNSLNSYFGLLRTCCNYNLRRDICTYLKSDIINNEIYNIDDKLYTKIVLKKKYRFNNVLITHYRNSYL